MAFTARDLSVLAYANGFTLWHYRTCDSLARLLGENDEAAANDNLGRDKSGGGETGSYFAPAAEMLRAGDEIKVNLIGPDGIDLIHLVVRNLTQAGAVEMACVGVANGLKIAKAA